MAERHLHNLAFLWINSWRMLWRDWRANELGILALGLVIAVTSITAVGFFTDRIERGLQEQSAELMGADLVVKSRNASVLQHADAIQELPLQVATTTQFRSVVLGEAQPHLVEVKAVSNGYPLRGTLRVSESPFAEDTPTDNIPETGTIWVDARLLYLLDAEIGQTVSLGEKAFTLRRVLRYEPDRAGDLFSMAPRVLMNQADLAATGLLGQGSRVTYRVLIAGARETVESYRATLKDQLQPGEQIQSVEEGRPELNTALERARQFLGLAALISVLLAGVAIATVAYRFTRRHLDTSAMLRCLGTTQTIIIRLFTLEMLWLALLASTAGCLLGLVTQQVIAQLLDQLLLVRLPAPSARPLLLGYATGIVLLLGFALPPLLALRRVPPLRVLRKDIATPPVSNGLLYLAVLGCMALLLYWQIGNVRLVSLVLAGMLGTLALLAVVAYGMIRLLNRMRTRVGMAWRFGLSNIARRSMTSMIQVVAIGLGLMVLLLLSTVRSDLLADWQNSLPPDAPNHFVINVQPDQVEEMRQFFSQLGVENTRLYPMVRARLVEINAEPVRATDYEEDRARRMVTREFNLSWAEVMQRDNTLVEGRWWTQADHGKPLLSLEAGLAETLGLGVGDVVSFNINGTVTDFTVHNLRTVEWDSFNINFFTVVPPGVLEQWPANWLTSVYLDSEQRRHLADLVSTFPNVTLIDVETLMQRVRQIMDRVSLAVEFIFLFTILAGLAVLYAAIQANQDERRFENAVLRTLGAKKQTLLLGLVAEFVLLGSLAGLLAGLSATSLAWLLAEHLFEFDYEFAPGVILLGLVSGIVIVTIAGLLGTRRVLTHPPMETLREGAG
ncbi:ABC transporter permease [Thiohalophilus sp.]|uniref:ABC transporter permease n=1 Tax=Thiohalophilus sp. TaxID=3028392 RepID=UPI002ACE4BAD|nr:FtsX-like permease family protein [Thiohalophilus sp.]MDZ7804553.1 FtsX-like permease family protein [Thiohalophilus sp.]